MNGLAFLLLGWRYTPASKFGLNPIRWFVVTQFVFELHGFGQFCFGLVEVALLGLHFPFQDQLCDSQEIGRPVIAEEGRLRHFISGFLKHRRLGASLVHAVQHG